MIIKVYSEETKRNCIALRRKFGDTPKELLFLERGELWVDFVNKIDLALEEKEACIEEFLNPKDLEIYNKKKKINKVLLLI